MRKISVVEQFPQNIPERIKVAAYARVSMDSDRLAHSLSTQVSYYSSLIQSNPQWEFAGIFADFGISGTGVKNRDEFNKMLKACEEGEIQLILTKSISRFARNTVDLLATVRHLKELGVEVRFEKENISTFSNDGELLLSLLAAFAEEESRSMGNNIKWAIRKGFEKGEPRHTPAFGYRWGGECFVVDENEAIAVRKIFDDFLKDVPLRETARWLKKNGYKSSTTTFIRYALQNIVYTGDLLLQRYYSETVLSRTVKVNDGVLPMYYVENSHEAIIDKETFEKVQQKIKENLDFNKEAHRIVKPKCFSAKIKCGCCGANYVSTPRRGTITDVGLVECWSCYKKVQSRKKLCQNGRISGKELRRICCEVMGTSEFDEYEFTQSVRQITLNIDGSLIFYFYDGRTATGSTHFYNPSDKKHLDPHSKIYGYNWTVNGYEINEPEAETVRMVYNYYNSGMTISDISRRMEVVGYKSKRGSFSRKFILYLLKNPFYIGTRIFPASYSGTGKEEIVVDDHEAIVSCEDYEKARERREKDAQRYHDSRNNKQANGSTDK